MAIAAIVPAGTGGTLTYSSAIRPIYSSTSTATSVRRVCTPEDAFALTGTGIDALAIGNCFLRKEVQELRLKRDYAHAFGLAPQWLQHVIM